MQWTCGLRTAVSIGVAVLPQGHLDELHLLGDGGQHPLLQTIELVKAAPRSHLTQTHKDTTHSLENTEHIHMMVMMWRWKTTMAPL